MAPNNRAMAVHPRSLPQRTAVSPCHMLVLLALVVMAVANNLPTNNGLHPQLRTTATGSTTQARSACPFTAHAVSFCNASDLCDWDIFGEESFRHHTPARS
jgi:hypothetical protein